MRGRGNTDTHTHICAKIWEGGGWRRKGILSYLVGTEEGTTFPSCCDRYVSVECARDGRFVFFFFLLKKIYFFISITHGRKEMADSISFGCYGRTAPRSGAPYHWRKKKGPQNQYVIQNVSLKISKKFWMIFFFLVGRLKHHHHHGSMLCSFPFGRGPNRTELGPPCILFSLSLWKVREPQQTEYSYTQTQKIHFVNSFSFGLTQTNKKVNKILFCLFFFHRR